MLRMMYQRYTMLCEGSSSEIKQIICISITDAGYLHNFDVSSQTLLMHFQCGLSEQELH